MSARETIPFLLALVLSLALPVPGCITLPDGSRALHPTVSRILADVVACAPAAINSDPYAAALAASTCHLDRVGDRLHAQPAQPSPDHGELVIRAARLEADGQHDAAVEAAKTCDQIARSRLVSP